MSYLLDVVWRYNKTPFYSYPLTLLQNVMSRTYCVTGV